MRNIPGRHIVFPGVLLVLVAAFVGPSRPDADRTDESDPADKPTPRAYLPLRMLAKQLAAADAGSGRRSLVETAALFRALNRLPPELPSDGHGLDSRNWSRHLPARTEEERLCLQVIGYATWPAAELPPGGTEATVRRLEDEFTAELRRHGAIRLPNLSPAAAEAQMDLARQKWSGAPIGAVFDGSVPARAR